MNENLSELGAKSVDDFFGFGIESDKEFSGDEKIRVYYIVGKKTGFRYRKCYTKESAAENRNEMNKSISRNYPKSFGKFLVEKNIQEHLQLNEYIYSQLNAMKIEDFNCFKRSETIGVVWYGFTEFEVRFDERYAQNDLVRLFHGIENYNENYL